MRSMKDLLRICRIVASAKFYDKLAGAGIEFLCFLF